MPDDPLEGHPSPTWESVYSVYEGEEPLYNEDGVDLTQIREMLALSPADRLRHMQNVINAMEALQHAVSQRLPADADGHG